MVLIHKKIFQIPKTYIISRWRKDIKRQHTRVVVSYDDWSCKPEGKRFDKMCSAFHEVADLAIESDEKCNMVVEWIKDFKEKLLVTTDIVNGSQPSQESNLSDANGADNKCTIKERQKPHDPFTIPCKGRPPTKRKESTMEKIVKKKATKNKAAKGQTSPANALIQQPPNNNLACYSSPFDHFSVDVSASSQFFPPYQVVPKSGGQSIVSVHQFGGENVSVRNDISTSTWQQPSQIVGFSYGSGIPNLRTPTFQVASANVRSSVMSTHLIPNQNASNATNRDGQYGCK